MATSQKMVHLGLQSALLALASLCMFVGAVDNGNMCLNALVSQAGLVLVFCGPECSTNIPDCLIDYT